jgi:DNA-binding response OmpR family regulator
MKILVVDDIREIREFLYLLLTAEGHEVRQSDSGRSALHANEEFNADVVISDVEMPNGNGVQLVRELRLRARRPGIVMISGAGCMVGSTDPFSAAKEAGAEFFLRKPFTRTNLLMAVGMAAAKPLAPPAETGRPLAH